MLEKIHMGPFCCAFSTQVENFRPLVGDDLIDELLDLARELKDVRICHINATPFGGGRGTPHPPDFPVHFCEK